MAALDDLNIKDWDKLAANLASLADKPVEKIPDPEKTRQPEVPDDGIPVITGRPKPVHKQAHASSWAGSWDKP